MRSKILTLVLVSAWSTTSFLTITAQTSTSIIQTKLQQTASFSPTAEYEIFSQLLSSDDGQRMAEQYVRKAEFLELDIETLDKLKAESPERLDLTFEIDGQTVVLEMFRSYPMSESYRISTSGGERIPQRELLFYNGSVRGNDASLASVSVLGNNVVIGYSDEYGDHRISRLNNSLYAHYLSRDLLEEKTFNCHADEIADTSSLPEIKPDEHRKLAVGDCVEIYFETDFATFEEHGSSITATEDFILATFNEVQLIYLAEGVPISISEIFIWTTEDDPYATLDSTSDVLNVFGGNVEDDYNGRLAHFVSTRSIGGGVAWLNVLCNNHSSSCYGSYNNCGPYAVSGGLWNIVVPFPNYSWNVLVIAHELGHNFGSHHTHSCVWNDNGTQIDDCAAVYNPAYGDGCFDVENPIVPDDGGTVMSYCHLLSSVGVNLSNGFGEQPGQLIYDNFVNASCSTGSCEGIPGCTNPEACNFDPSAETDDGSCLLPGSPCDDGNPCTQNDVLGEDCSCSGEALCEGDYNLDCQVNTTDILAFLGAFGCEFDCEFGDMDGDGAVLTGDLLQFLSLVGSDCLPAQ